jgi:outer membrane protein assembly factor BamB
MEREAERTLCDLVFVGFNSRVIALDRESGEKVWRWDMPKGRGFVAVLLDGDRLVVSCDGYTYALNPMTGEPLWENHLEGEGTGIPCLASIYGSTSTAQTAYVDAQRRSSDTSQARPD